MPPELSESDYFAHSSDVQHELPDMFVDNPRGGQAIFHMWKSKLHQGPEPLTPPLPPDARRYPSAGELLPRVDRLEELLQWAEAQAAANGILPPYMREGFVAVSVIPQRAPSGGNEAGSSCDVIRLIPDLPPLHEIDVEMQI